MEANEASNAAVNRLGKRKSMVKSEAHLALYRSSRTLASNTRLVGFELKIVNKDVVFVVVGNRLVNFNVSFAA